MEEGRNLHKRVEAKNLTADELRNSWIPDNLITAIWVDFKSKAGKNYTAVHVPTHPINGPYILLSSPDKDCKDFVGVESTVAKEAVDESKNFLYGILGRVWNRADEYLSIYDRGSDICDVISLHGGKVTQSGVANLAERYASHFDDVKISRAYFHDVPQPGFGISMEKLILS